MRIENIETLEKIFSAIDVKQIFGKLHYLLINTFSNTWKTDFATQLQTIENEKQLLGIALLVKNTDDSARVDTILLICRRNELDEDFLKQISRYINKTDNESESELTILRFLEQQWKRNPSSYALTFLWTTIIDLNYTHISDRAIATAYQRKGMMKQISLAMINELEKIYGKNHKIRSLVIHKATYLFFNPHDKDCNHFYSGELQEATCSILSECHQKKNVLQESPKYYFAPQTLQLLQERFGMFKISSVDVDKNTTSADLNLKCSN